ncbi:hypothetical protein ES319_D05G379700v1 [Gossypium barbadense]|uniref:Uncharacterized protein n=1 Tax=Gossypium barbadense TaxID=3634 RepID=A0A5J5RQA8_GOSBA|nr:hypothetical protein ES319_D05G379700v1 [Gossypium barbadense]
MMPPYPPLLRHGSAKDGDLCRRGDHGPLVRPAWSGGRCADVVAHVAAVRGRSGARTACWGLRRLSH